MADGEFRPDLFARLSRYPTLGPLSFGLAHPLSVLVYTHHTGFSSVLLSTQPIRTGLGKMEEAPKHPQGPTLFPLKL